MRLATDERARFLEVLGEVRHRTVVHSFDTCTRRNFSQALWPLAIAGSEHALGEGTFGEGTPGRFEDGQAQRPKEEVGLARDHEVEPREGAVGGHAHLRVGVGAAEHGHDGRVGLLHLPEERERGRLLLEDG